MMKNHPLISVIIPAYNAEKFIADAIESVLAQTIKNVEILVCDDASTDETASVVRRYFYDERIKLLCNDRNFGPGYCRNRCIDSALGKWVALLDADDVLVKPERLERMIRVAEQEFADVVFDNLFLLSERGRPLGVAFKPSGGISSVTAEEYVKRDGAHGFQIGFLQAVIRSESIRGIRQRPELSVGEDFVFIMECLIGGAKAVYMAEPMYGYRQTGGSATRSPDPRKWPSLLAGNDIILQHATAKGMPEVADALRKRGRRISRTIDYMRICRLFREGKVLSGIHETVRTIDGMSFYLSAVCVRWWRRVWHTNVSFVRLPPCSPELSPARQSWLRIAERFLWWHGTSRHRDGILAGADDKVDKDGCLPGTKCNVGPTGLHSRRPKKD